MPTTTSFSERKRAERLTERAEHNVFAASASTVGGCPACGLMILGPEPWVRVNGQLYHRGCAVYTEDDRGMGGGG